jgi:hypothetical protein
MIIAYYPHSTNTHNLKDVEFKILKNWSMFLNFRIARVIYHV